MNKAEVISILKELGEMLSPYAREGWEIVVRQHFVASIIWSIFWAVCVVVSGMIHYAMCRLILKETPGSDRYSVISAFLCIGAVVAFAFTFMLINSLIGVFNPEFLAIQTLLDLGGR